MLQEAKMHRVRTYEHLTAYQRENGTGEEDEAYTCLQIQAHQNHGKMSDLTVSFEASVLTFAFTVSSIC